MAFGTLLLSCFQLCTSLPASGKNSLKSEEIFFRLSLYNGLTNPIFHQPSNDDFFRKSVFFVTFPLVETGKSAYNTKDAVPRDVIFSDSLPTGR